MKSSTLRHAFTLIELLVVIAIIAILAAILFPVFAQAKEAAKKASCLSGVKQNALAAYMYANDYDDFVVPYVMQVVNAPAATFTYWFSQVSCTDIGNQAATCVYSQDKGLIQPYMKNLPILKCPSADLAYGQNLIPSNSTPIPSVSYGVNLNVTGANTSANFSDIQRTAETIYMADSAAFSPSGQLAEQLQIGYSTSAPKTHGLHAGMANVGWCDGHAKSVKVTIAPTATTAQQKNVMGNVMNPLYPVGDPNAGFYYNLAKP